MKDLFDNIDNQLIVDFIKDTHFTISYNVVSPILYYFILLVYLLL